MRPVTARQTRSTTGGVDLRGWFKEMLTACLDTLGLEEVRLIGHSQGAMLALWLALDAPKRVRSVVSIGLRPSHSAPGSTRCAFWHGPELGGCSSRFPGRRPHIAASWLAPWGGPQCAPIPT